MSLLKDKNGNNSSKRVAGFSIGGIGIALAITLFFFSIYKTIKDPQTAKEVVKTLLYVASGLLGIGVIENFGTKK